MKPCETSGPRFGGQHDQPGAAAIGHSDVARDPAVINVEGFCGIIARVCHARVAG